LPQEKVGHELVYEDVVYVLQWAAIFGEVSVSADLAEEGEPQRQNVAGAGKRAARRQEDVLHIHRQGSRQ
jgi:hypothetical protein